MKNKALTITILGLLLSGAGIIAALIITWLDFVPKISLVLESIFVASVGFLLIILTVEIVSAIKIDDSTYHTALIAGCLVALYVFSQDMQLFFADLGVYIPNIVFSIASEIAFALTCVCCCWYVAYLYGLKLERKTFILITVSIVLTLAAYIITSVFGYGYIVHFVAVVIAVLTFCNVLYCAEKKKEISATTYFTAAVFALSIGAQSVNSMFFNDSTVAVPGLSLAYSALTFAMFLFVYFRFSLHADKKAAKSTEYKHQAELFETKALSGQIKPHFIFNSLEAIRALYHQDIAVGDEALNRLSSFLRGSINSFDSELIPFETEIDNIFNYTEFENLKSLDKTDVIFNIDFTEFYVPPFSVQPFVENALKHSGTDKTGGSIIISSYKSGDFAVVEIIDNGKGFDASQLSPNSRGIKNACGRFALTLGVMPEIKSELGVGTRVKIVIDLTKQGERSK